MTIHKGNIEAYLLDYIEGNLDALLTAELMAFLSENPEYEKSIPEYDGHLCLEAGPVFEDKALLKKNFEEVPQINEHNFDEFCIASTEGLLDGKDKARLDDYLFMHPEKQRDFDVFGKLILPPDYLLVYPDKKELKKREPFIIPLRFLYYASGIAASIALLLLLVWRKPADKAISGSLPGTEIVPKQNDIPAPEEIIPLPAAGTPSSLPAGNFAKGSHSITQEELMAVENKPDLQPLAAIAPRKTSGVFPGISIPGIQKVTRQTEMPLSFPEPVEIAYAPAQTPARILGSLVKKLNLWKAAEKAVTGFNYLTESRLSLVRTTDENGKFSSLSLESEEYTDSDNKVK